MLIGTIEHEADRIHTIPFKFPSLILIEGCLGYIAPIIRNEDVPGEPVFPITGLTGHVCFTG